MIVNKCSENLFTKSKKLYENYRDNCTVVQRMLEKYKKIYLYAFYGSFFSQLLCKILGQCGHVYQGDLFLTRHVFHNSYIV